MCQANAFVGWEKVSPTNDPIRWIIFLSKYIGQYLALPHNT